MMFHTLLTVQYRLAVTERAWERKVLQDNRKVLKGAGQNYKRDGGKTGKADHEMLDEFRVDDSMR